MNACPKPSQMRRRRVVFLAAHLLSPTIASGGDVLFCEIAARLRTLRPEWEIIAVAPDFCHDALQPYFERVVTFQTSPREGRQGSPVSVALTWSGRFRKVADLLRVLEPDLVHCTGDFFVDVLPARCVQQAMRFRWSGNVHHVNAPPHKRRNAFSVALASFVLQRISFSALRAADAVLLLNTGVASELAALGFRRDRLAIVGAGIDLNRFPLLPPASERTRVIWINRMEPTKGIFDLPAIVAGLPDNVVVDVVGSGPTVFMERLKAELAKGGLTGRCVLHGYLSHEALQDTLAKASVFISCSYEEGWGISIAEALASALPCIAYDLPSHREIFGDLIVRVPRGDTAAFATAIVDTLQHPDDAETRARRRAAMSQFSLDECARRQEAVFERLMVTMPEVSDRV